VLKTSNEFKEHIPEHFNLHLPKDIVSSDFYWFTCIDNLVIIAVMDCTGHGVPGALMNALGVTLLNETVLRERILSPDLILENLRAKLIKTLSQKGYSGVIRDGIEGSVFCFDIFMNQFHYSGSCNSMIIIHEDELQEIKPQRIPIGFSDKEVNFKNVSLNLSKNDLVYMFSDGYVDQFGGPEAKTKRFMIKRFKEILLGNHSLPLEQQREILLSELNSWKGDSDQTDDILVLGIRF
jgi:serine phosphatase RsbU (regulator of sigma subunit)